MTSTSWNQRYEDTDLVWSATPNIWVEQLAADLAAGRALDIAAGEGRNSLWLAARGWQVTAVDFSAVALARARQIADRELGRGAGPFETVEADVATWVPRARSYDLVLVAYLHLSEQQRRVAMRGAAEAVAPGGTLLVVGHDRTNLTAGHGGPQNPAVLYRPQDIVADIEPAQLALVRAETVERPVRDDQGQPKMAFDVVVMATRAVQTPDPQGAPHV